MENWQLRDWTNSVELQEEEGAPLPTNLEKVCLLRDEQSGLLVRTDKCVTAGLGGRGNGALGAACDCGQWLCGSVSRTDRWC